MGTLLSYRTDTAVNLVLMKWITRITNRLSELDTIQAGLSNFLRRQAVPEPVIGDTRLITEEVLANIIAYGYDEEEHCIQLSAMVNNGLLSLEFKDNGKAFNPLAAPLPDLERPVEERPIGGLGIYLIRVLAEKTTYTREAEENVLTVEKTFTPDLLRQS